MLDASQRSPCLVPRLVASIAASVFLTQAGSGRADPPTAPAPSEEQMSERTADGARRRPMGRGDARWGEATPDGARRRPMGRGDARWGEATPDGARRRPMGRGDTRWGEATPDGARRRPMGRGDTRWGGGDARWREATPDGHQHFYYFVCFVLFFAQGHKYYGGFSEGRLRKYANH